MRALPLVVAGVLLLSGCSYGGVNSLSLPGTAGTGAGSYLVDIELANAANIVPNNPVRVDDVNVGTIRSVRLEGFRAVVTVSLGGDVVLPANAEARIGQASLLGAKFLELAPPALGAVGRLRDGDRLPIGPAGNYPETEDTLAAVAALLNGSGLQQVKTITRELNRALDGRTGDYRELFTQLEMLTVGLEEQKGSIVAAIDGVDRLGARLAEQNGRIDTALDTVPGALDVLATQRVELVDALDRLGEFGVATDDLVQRGGDDLVANVENLTPTLRALADSGTSLTDSLYLAGTLIFPLKTFDEVFRGDFVNFWLTLDLSLPTLDRNFLTGTPLEGSLGDTATVLANLDRVGRPGVDPLTDPLTATGGEG